MALWINAVVAVIFEYDMNFEFDIRPTDSLQKQNKKVIKTGLKFSKKLLTLIKKTQTQKSIRRNLDVDISL